MRSQCCHGLIRLMLLWLALLAGAQAQTLSQAAKGASSADDEANAVVLEVMLDRHSLSDSLTAYQYGDQFLLPLGELARLLTLAITVNSDEGQASGFIIREDRVFGLNVARATVDVNGREQTFDARQVRVIGDDVYVSQQLLKTWLPIDFDVDLPTLQLRVKPRVKLPLQERLQRDNNGAPSNALTSAGSDKAYPRQIAPYALMGKPFIDQTFGSDARFGRDASQYKAAYAAYITTDFLGMETSAYVSSTREKPTPDLRVTMGRNDPDGQLLGPLHARSLSIGNVVVPSVPNVLTNGQGSMGVAVSNRPLGQPSNFDRHNIRGDLPPGWDVTLYYNDSLVGYQPAGADGRYAFDNLPLSFGPNEFRLVFNGPLGQVRVERQSYLLDQAVVKPGEFFYAMAQQQMDEGGALHVAQFDLGLTHALSASVGLVDKTRSGNAEAARYAQVGLRGYWDNLIVNTAMSRSPDGGVLVDTGIKSRIGTYAVALDHLQRNKFFVSDLFFAGDDGVRFRDKLAVSGAVNWAGLPPLSIALEGARDVLESGMDNINVAGRLSTMLQGTAVSNSLRWQRTAQSATSDGSLQLSRRLVDVGLNAQMDYGVRPELALHTFAFTADRPLPGGYRVNGGIIYNRVARSTQFAGGLSKSFGSFALAVSAGYSSAHEKTVGLQLFMALGRDPRSKSWFADSQPLAGTGGVSVQTFVDKNMNGVRDPGEEAVPNAGFVINNGGRHPARTDSHGQAFIGRLSPSQYTDVAIDPSTLEDPQWKPMVPGVRVLPRPGVVQTIDFPVVYAAEVEGTVYLVDSEGRRRGIGDAHVEMVDGHGVVLASAKSSSDGYYLLHQVTPGKGTLRIAPDQARKLHLSGHLSHPLDVPANGDFLAGQDFELHITPH